jgi:phage major head subunit gpT-like protein
MNIIVTPQIVRRIEDNLQYITVSAWKRRERNLWWRRVMKTRTSATKKELLQWMLETAQIQPMGNGGNLTTEDLVEIYWEIENEKYGAGLTLSADDISDGAGLDRAGQWARHIGNAGAYWPQKEATRLLKNGKTLLCYDGQPFFDEEHPVNPYIGEASGVYPNLFTGMPFSAENLAEIYAQIEGIEAPDGSPRHLRPTMVLAGPVERLAVTQALGAEIMADPVSSGTTAPATNMIKTSYGFVEPIIAPELNEVATVGGRSRGVWFLGCELIEDDELGGLIYQERQAYTMNSYSPMTDAELGRLDAFEWQLKGRNAASYGHPFLLFRVEPD